MCRRQLAMLRQPQVLQRGTAQRPVRLNMLRTRPQLVKPCSASGLELAPQTLSVSTTYAVFASLAAMFGLTFGVAPRYRSSFKEEDSWLDMYNELVAMGGVQSISAAEAMQRVRKGARLVDVRLERKWQEAAIEGSENFALYQPIAGWGLAANIRRAGFAFFGIFGTERNQGWLQEVQARIPRDKEVILACDMGGSMQCKPGADTGFQSQSLKAAYYLKKAGYKKVFHLQGGINDYKRAVGPLVAQTEAKEESLLDRERVRA